MNTTTQRGFTLFELLVTMAVVGVIFGFGVPNLLEFVRNNRMVSIANDFVAAITSARNTAVTRRAPVTLCASPDPIAATPDCDSDASDPDSQGGFVVWVDTNADAVVDAGEDIILRQDDPGNNITVLGDAGYIHFAASGFAQTIPSEGAGATELLFCDARGNTVSSGSLSAARGIRISPTGRPAMLREVAEIATLGLACP